MQPKRRGNVRARSVVVVITASTWSVAVIMGGGSAVGVEPAPIAPRPRVIVDQAVAPAGGLACPPCGVAAGVPHCGHLAGCRDGACAPHCPVRPSQYGFYNTHWRRWPGAGVVPVSAEEAATPVAPPAAQVPGPNEESPRPPEDEPLAPAADAEPPVAPDRAAPPETPAAEAERERAGDAVPATTRPAGPADARPVPPSPPGEPPIPPAGEDPAAGAPDQSAVPTGGVDVATESGAMRYPAQVGRAIAAGVAPWRLGSTHGQRGAASARGL